MSVPVFIRKPDGTAWEGRISFGPLLKRDQLKISFDNTEKAFASKIYQTCCSCPSLHINSELLKNSEVLNLLYRFLYGYTYEELSEVEYLSNIPLKYRYTPIEWTSQTVVSMDWDLFCFLYYTVLCSSNNFDSKAWEILCFILKELKESPEILSTLLENSGREFNDTSCSVFWTAVCEGIQSKIQSWLQEKNCYNAFDLLIKTQPLFSDDTYNIFKDDCCKVLDIIARKRINDACTQKYTVYQLINFDIELLFFYNYYFTSTSNANTKQYVMNATFNLLHTNGDLIATNNVLDADAIYTTALKFAQTASDRQLIANKRKSILSEVNAAKLAKEKVDQDRRLKEEKKKRTDKLLDKFVLFFISTLFISIISTILFGILTLFEILAFSRIAFNISLCIMVPHILILVVALIYVKYTDSKY